ncbi:hypothetical protein M9H77_06383 [Catharanthus roseus]|uniref:Uncharacterized protein n=1 Tax=Catharanthus roseus TaxID=4058 RepID=A0ACC0BSD4_CATRO|nr:hypothetical protein M9H77_06383 [Catharanthus roseus]
MDLVSDWVKGDTFQTAAVYTCFTPARLKQSWAKIVWNPTFPPKFSFIMWLTVLGRLPMIDSLTFLEVDRTCNLCKQNEETLSHLCFACPFRGDTWTAIQEWTGLPRRMTTMQSCLKWLNKDCRGTSWTCEENFILQQLCNVYGSVKTKLFVSLIFRIGTTLFLGVERITECFYYLVGHGGKKFLTPILSETDVSLLFKFGTSTGLIDVYVVQHLDIRIFPKAKVIAKAKAEVYGKRNNLKEKSNSTVVKKRTPRKKQYIGKRKRKVGESIDIEFQQLKVEFQHPLIEFQDATTQFQQCEIEFQQPETHLQQKKAEGRNTIDSVVINNEDSAEYNSNELRSGSDSGSDDNEGRLKKRHERFRPEIDMEDPKFEASLINESKDALNDAERVKGERIIDWHMRTLNDEHKCSRSFDPRIVGPKYLSKSGQNIWPRSEKPTLLPPKILKLLGRPKKLRRKDPYESEKIRTVGELHKMKRVSNGPNTCKNCGQKGTTKGNASEAQNQPDDLNISSQANIMAMKTFVNSQIYCYYFWIDIDFGLILVSAFAVAVTSQRSPNIVAPCTIS